MSKKKKEEKKTTLEDGTEVDPYSIDKLQTIPVILKILLIKFWVVGAAFLFVVMGLRPETFDTLDKLVLLILIITLGIEYISNLAISFMDRPEKPIKHHMSHDFNKRKFYSLFVTLLYATVMVLLTHFTLEFLVRMGMKTIGDFISESTADPFTFAIIFLIYDMLYIYLRIGIKSIIHKNKHEGEI